MSFETIKLYNYVCQAIPSGYWLLNQKVFKGASLNDYRILLKANFWPPGTFWRSHCVTFRKLRMKLCLSALGGKRGGNVEITGITTTHPLSWMQPEASWFVPDTSAGVLLEAASHLVLLAAGFLFVSEHLCGDKAHFAGHLRKLGCVWLCCVFLFFFKHPKANRLKKETPQKHLTGTAHSSKWLVAQILPAIIE